MAGKWPGPAQAQEGYRHKSDAAMPRLLPVARTPDVLLETPARDMSTSTRGGPSRIPSRRAAIPSESSLSSSPSFLSSSSGESCSEYPSASTSRGVSRAPTARGSFSSRFSFSSPWQTFASPQTRASSHDRRCPPLPEASRTEHRSIPIRASVSPREDRKDQKLSNSNRKSSLG